MNKKVHEIVDHIIRDLTDRRGLKHEWERIEEDIQQEIRMKWESIVKVHLQSGD